MKVKLLLGLTLVFLFSLGGFFYSILYPQCPKFHLAQVGELQADELGNATEFIFLDPSHALVAFYPHKTSTSLRIYTKKNGIWEYDKEASREMPSTYHARQIIKEDLDGDGQDEILLADHGVDQEPFPGSHPFILRKNDGQWRYDPNSSKLPKAFTFNLAVMDSSEGRGLFLAHLSPPSPVFYHYNSGDWKDISYLIPQDITSGTLCLMTALVADLDQDGAKDLYLGGCDRPEESQIQAYDRILARDENGTWQIQKSVSLPLRKMDSRWGTVFIKEIKYNEDHFPDLLIATHDFGFHYWKALIYENQSSPGNFSFREVILPLSQETESEGYIHAMEDFSVVDGMGIFVEVRSVARTPGKRAAILGNRLLLQDRDRNFVDASSCLPPELKDSTARMARKYPDNPARLLLVPENGVLYDLIIEPWAP